MCRCRVRTVRRVGMDRRSIISIARVSLAFEVWCVKLISMNVRVIRATTAERVLISSIDTVARVVRVFRARCVKPISMSVVQHRVRMVLHVLIL